MGFLPARDVPQEITVLMSYIPSPSYIRRDNLRLTR